MKNIKRLVPILLALVFLMGITAPFAEAATGPQYLSKTAAKSAAGKNFEEWGTASYSYVVGGNTYIHFGNRTDFMATWHYKPRPINGGGNQVEFLLNNVGNTIQNLIGSGAKYYVWLRYSKNGQLDIAQIKRKTTTEYYFGYTLFSVK
ncbi:hypothetical protein [Neobacillus vireti]|uniref:hypothetical protein n=1 Tax=Neobacillus vireti TaxID=220686 RepID=UPI002FFF1718